MPLNGTTPVVLPEYSGTVVYGKRACVSNKRSFSEHQFDPSSIDYAARFQDENEEQDGSNGAIPRYEQAVHFII
jgi:hypothetical protein